MPEVDVTEGAKQVALYRYELTGELYDNDEIRNFFYNNITELEQEQRDEITSESWLEEMISFTESDDTLTGGTRQRWPKCGTGQSDRAMSVLAHEPGAARRARGSPRASRPRAYGLTGPCRNPLVRTHWVQRKLALNGTQMLSCPDNWPATTS
jgi:hypothetical protein